MLSSSELPLPIVMTHTERVQFAIRFAQRDLAMLSEQDQRILHAELCGFLISGLIGPLLAGRGIIVGNLWPFPLPDDTLRTIQKDTGTLLKEMLESRDVVPHPTRGIPLGIRIRLQSLQGVLKRNLVHITGPERDVFYCVLALLLGQEPTDRVQRCPECRTIFYRIRKQKYCSHVCANRVSVRRWRKSHGGKAYKRAEAARAHNRYAEKKKAAVGPGAKVTRRPRASGLGHKGIDDESTEQNQEIVLPTF